MLLQTTSKSQTGERHDRKRKWGDAKKRVSFPAQGIEHTPQTTSMAMEEAGFRKRQSDCRPVDQCRAKTNEMLRMAVRDHKISVLRRRRSVDRFAKRTRGTILSMTLDFGKRSFGIGRLALS